ELRTPDNVQLLVPNGKVWGATVTNFSVHESRRLDLKMVVDGAADLDQVMTTIGDTMAADPRTRKDRPPSVTVTEIAEQTVTLAAQVWCAADDHAELKVALMKTLKQRLTTTLKTLSA